MSPSGGFVSLLCDQLGPSNGILHQFYCARLLVVTRFLSLDVTVCYVKHVNSIHLLTPYISAVFYTHPFANFLSLPPCQLSTNFMDGPLHMCENNQKKDHLHNRGDTKCVSNIVHKKCTGQW